MADTAVEIHSVYSEVHEMCRDYVCPDGRERDLLVETTEEDIERESRQSDEERKYEGLPPYQFERPYLETLAVYRKLCSVLPERDILLMHGSVIAVDGEGYLFTAASGTGKSTHVRLWRQLFGDRAVMVNDDKPLVRVYADREPIVYGTPWDGKHHLSSNIAVPLKAICILERGQENEIHSIPPEEAYPMLLQQTFRPKDAMGLMRTMQLLNTLGTNLGLYRLHCNMNPEAAKVAYKGMKIDD